jgi:predicted aspartyl protease
MNQKSLFPLYGKQKSLDCSWRRLNPFSISVLVVASCLSFGWGATAQEYPGCFLKTRSGEVVPLPEVCAYPEPEPLPEGSTAVSPEGGVYQAQIIRRDGNIPVIEVLFNDQQSFEMLVDTGATGTVITPIMADFLGVVPAGTGLANTPSARNVEFDVGLVQSINVAGAVKDNIAVAIAPALDIGLLGQDFFGQYDVTIKQDVVEFRERSSQSQPTPLSEPVGEPSQPIESQPPEASGIPEPESSGSSESTGGR